MFSNYLKIAFRNYAQNKLYFVINLLGLSVGLACFIVTMLWVKNELSYDKHIKNHDRIYRIAGDLVTDGNIDSLAYAHRFIPFYTRAHYPQVEAITGIYKVISLISYGTNNTLQNNTFYADTGFFKVFALDFIKGNPDDFCRHKNAAVLTEDMAQELFGNTNTVGKTIQVYNARGNDYNTRHNGKPTAWLVTGVIKNNPQNSHFHPEVILSKSKPKYMFEYVYMLLKKGYSAQCFSNEVWPDLYKKYIGSYFNMDAQSFRLRLQPLESIHLSSGLHYEIEPNGKTTNVLILSLFAVLVLLIACVNYIILGITNSIKRTPEIGVKKVMGATRWQIGLEFFSESFLLVILAFIISLAFVECSLPHFTSLTGQSLTNHFLDGQLFFIIALLVMAVGFITGAYPAFYASALNPSLTLSNRLLAQKGFSLRRILVILQLTISVITIIASMVISGQLQFMKSRDLGFRREQVMLVPVFNPIMQKNTEALKAKLLKNKHIRKVAASVTTPGQEMIHLATYFEVADSMRHHVIATLCVDADYMDLMNIRLLDGKQFNKDMKLQTDTTVYCLVNESAKKMLGWDHTVGKKISTFADSGTVRTGFCLGEVKDFHTNSLHQSIQPAILRFGYARTPGYQWLSILIDGTDVKNTIQYIKQEFMAQSQGYPFNYSFMDEAFNRQYLEEEKQSFIIKLFSYLSVFISCIGLLGLTSYTILLRLKEIGIRKISGAPVSQIVYLLSVDFIKLVLISLVIAFPISFYLMNTWLQNFAYHITVSWSIFTIAGLTSLIIALLTVSYHTIKAANQDLALVLKHE